MYEYCYVSNLDCIILDHKTAKRQIISDGNAIPKYHDNAYDPDPEKSYTRQNFKGD